MFCGVGIEGREKSCHWRLLSLWLENRGAGYLGRRSAVMILQSEDLPVASTVWPRGLGQYVRSGYLLHEQEFFSLKNAACAAE